MKSQLPFDTVGRNCGDSRGQKSEVWKDVNCQVVGSSGPGSNSQTRSYGHSLPEAGLSNLTDQLGCPVSTVLFFSDANTFTQTELYT